MDFSVIGSSIDGCEANGHRQSNDDRQSKCCEHDEHRTRFLIHCIPRHCRFDSVTCAVRWFFTDEGLWIHELCGDFYIAIQTRISFGPIGPVCIQSLSLTCIKQHGRIHRSHVGVRVRGHPNPIVVESCDIASNVNGRCISPRIRDCNFNGDRSTDFPRLIWNIDGIYRNHRVTKIW